MVKKNACVFISGKGTNLYSLIKNSRSYNFPIKICLIVCNNPLAEGLLYAKKYSIPYIIINTKRKFFEIKILNELKKKNISLICLAGYMKILSSNFISLFGKKIINIHPSLLPKFKGTNTFQRIIKSKEKITGCTVHFVDKGLDSGQIILKKKFYIVNKDTEEDLRSFTQKLEHKAYAEAIFKIYN